MRRFSPVFCSMAVLVVGMNSHTFANCGGNAVGGYCGINVSAQSVVKVPPDEATFLFSVESSNPEVDVAVQKNNEDTLALKKYLKAEGAMDIQSDPTIIDSRYSQTYENGANKKKFDGYMVRTTVSCWVKDPSKVKIVSAGALNHGATSVLLVQLRASQIEKARATARQQAMALAKAKAADLAKQAGRAVGEIQSISEDQYPNAATASSTFAMLFGSRTDMGYPNPLFNNYAYGSSPETSWETNKLMVTSIVRLCVDFKDSAKP